ncbi:thermonuclease family protein [Hansschlegelia sp. KR7-227]|uniref:thermonuclease family protein n=1 Tax=Hansschlegelia sp. KR7-227 TaxID=3400914 RepID=UPI003C11BC61
MSGSSRAVSASASARVIDGDTIDVGGERIRLRSTRGPIDAPELRDAKCPLELFKAEAARDRLKAILGEELACNDRGVAFCRGLDVRRDGADRYGRTVAIIYYGGRDVGDQLVLEGHAKPWPRLSRADRPQWCAG